jgi:ribosomal-protein-alanine N-acetyltransferase
MRAGDIVPIEPVHAALLAGMHRVCFAEPWDKEAMGDLLAMPGAYGFLALPQAESGSLPLGFALCRVAADEAEILTILVLPPFRRSGLARELLKQTLDKARLAGSTAIFLEVAADNIGARSLYSSEGFEQVGKRPRYYGNAIDAFVMKKVL